MVMNLLEVSTLVSKGLWCSMKISPCRLIIVIIFVRFIVCNRENICKQEFYSNEYDLSDVTIFVSQDRQIRQWKFRMNRAKINDEVNVTLNVIYYQEVHNAVLRC